MVKYRITQSAEQKENEQNEKGGQTGPWGAKARWGSCLLTNSLSHLPSFPGILK